MKINFRTRATLALTIAATYVATHLPLAITALVTYPLMAQGDVYLDWPTLCQVKPPATSIDLLQTVYG